MTDLEAKSRDIVDKLPADCEEDYEATAAALILQALRAEREACARVVEAMVEHYPTDVFIPPSPGQHGKTVDACSAAAILAILPTIAAAIRQGRT